MYSKNEIIADFELRLKTADGIEESMRNAIVGLIEDGEDDPVKTDALFDFIVNKFDKDGDGLIRGADGHYDFDFDILHEYDSVDILDMYEEFIGI